MTRFWRARGAGVLLVVVLAMTVSGGAPALARPHGPPCKPPAAVVKAVKKAQHRYPQNKLCAFRMVVTDLGFVHARTGRVNTKRIGAFHRSLRSGAFKRAFAATAPCFRDAGHSPGCFSFLGMALCVQRKAEKLCPNLGISGARCGHPGHPDHPGDPAR